MCSIYLVEDDRELANILALHLKKSGYEVTLFHRGDDAMKALVESPPDLVILDIMLPGMDGLEILQRLHRESNVLVMLASAKGAEVDRVIGLELGGDDYLVKPLSGREMVARVKALFRRRERERAPSSRNQASSHTIGVGQITLDIDKKFLFGRQGGTELTPSEFEILHRMMNAPGRTFRREELGESLEAEGQHHSRAVDVHVGNLRKKIAHIGVMLDPIRSIRGVGYRLVKSD